MDELTLSEQAQLAQWEYVIRRGLQVFHEVGTALLEIRDRRLYRAEYSTFEDYCRERWAMTRMRASQLIAASEVMANVNNCLQVPQNEAQARPLTRLEPDLQREAWQEAVETAPNGKVTAAHVESVVELHTNGRSAMLQTMNSHVTPEWYTPASIIERVLTVLEYIDLDPCSNSHESPNVPAGIHFTKEDDGLSQVWRGRVYMNPPYGYEIGDWIDHLLDAHSVGGIEAAIALLPARTDTIWFRSLWQFPCCFLYGRLRFSGYESGAPFPSVVVYLGPNTQRFADVFGEIGTVVSKWQQPQSMTLISN